MFGFSDKRDREYFVEHAEGAVRLCAKDAYDEDRFLYRVKVPYSGQNLNRKIQVRLWYANKRSAIQCGAIRDFNRATDAIKNKWDTAIANVTRCKH